MGAPRSHPLDPPYEAQAHDALRRTMPAGMDPVLLAAIRSDEQAKGDDDFDPRLAMQRTIGP